LFGNVKVTSYKLRVTKKERQIAISNHRSEMQNKKKSFIIFSTHLVELIWNLEKRITRSIKGGIIGPQFLQLS
jgi:hypothetical protein